MDYRVNHISMQEAKFTVMVKGVLVQKSRRSGKKIKPTTITIHSTANPSSTALNERNWLINKSNTRMASWHIAVDDKMIVEALPLNEHAYHAGSVAGNNTSIGIEICESGNREKTLQNTVQLVAVMLHDRGWGVDRLRRHFDWSSKNCPNIMSANNWAGWNKFKSDVQRELNKLKQPKKEEVNMGKSVITEPNSWAKVAWDWATKEGLLDGTRPRDMITREEMAIVLKRLHDSGKLK